ncbi:MAG: TATA-box-binding protein [Candidatus Syntropharchaeia archaeon]
MLIKIENVVANAKIADELDLSMIGIRLDGAQFTKKKFPGLVYKIDNPKAAFLIFRSGKVVCTGTKSVDEVKRAMDEMLKDLRKIGVRVKENPKFTVQNIVASTNLGKELNLNAIALGMDLENMEYEPEVFPGLVYRISDPKVAVLIFRSGKLIITGSKNEEDCKKAVEILRNELKSLNLL